MGPANNTLVGRKRRSEKEEVEARATNEAHERTSRTQSNPIQRTLRKDPAVRCKSSGAFPTRPRVQWKHSRHDDEPLTSASTSSTYVSERRVVAAGIFANSVAGTHQGLL